MERTVFKVSLRFSSQAFSMNNLLVTVNVKYACFPLFTTFYIVIEEVFSFRPITFYVARYLA